MRTTAGAAYGYRATIWGHSRPVRDEVGLDLVNDPAAFDVDELERHGFAGGDRDDVVVVGPGHCRDEGAPHIDPRPGGRERLGIDRAHGTAVLGDGEPRPVGAVRDARDDARCDLPFCQQLAGGRVPYPHHPILAGGRVPSAVGSRREPAQPVVVRGTHVAQGASGRAAELDGASRRRRAEQPAQVRDPSGG